MLRRLKKKSLQRRAWCMGSFLCPQIDEEVYAHVRHRLQRCGGTETRVKLSTKGWVSGGGRNMPSQFYALDMVNTMQPDTVYGNVLLCVFRRTDTAADFPFEIAAYKFDSAKGPIEFQQLFNNLCSPLRNGGTKLVKKQSALPVRGTDRRTANKRAGLMPGRPTHGVFGAVAAADRWAAKDRTTPRLFATRSMEDLLDDKTTASRSHPRRHLSVDNLDNDLSDYDNETQTSTSTTNLQPFVLPADTVLEDLNGALDGAWWSEDSEAARTADVGVAATFPDATDSLRKQRRAGLEFWADADGVACQAYMPVTSVKTVAVGFYDDDDDDYDDSLDNEFKWVFSSDDEDEQCSLVVSSSVALNEVHLYVYTP